MNFVSLVDLLVDAEALARKLPADLAGVVGIPRSGMLVASLLSLSRGVGLADLDGFVRSGGAFARPGQRVNWEPPERGSVVVVDDSVHGGQAMENARRQIRFAPALRQAFRTILYAAVYATDTAAIAVDLSIRTVPAPRIFQWNLWTHPLLRDAQMDLDGVICEEPPPEDGGAYEHALETCSLRLLHRPQQCVAEIVTGRLEKYRKCTARWLDNHGVRYKNLTMCPALTPEIRRSVGAWQYKAMAYGKSGAALFIESDAVQASQIAQFTGKPVLCVDDWKLRKGT